MGSAIQQFSPDGLIIALGIIPIIEHSDIEFLSLRYWYGLGYFVHTIMGFAIWNGFLCKHVVIVFGEHIKLIFRFLGHLFDRSGVCREEHILFGGWFGLIIGTRGDLVI